MLSMFKEKDCNGKETSCWSMTRVVAFLAALTLNFAIITMSKNSHVHDIGWPFCAMYVVTLLAVPIQALFRMVQAWLDTIPGKKLVYALIEKAQIAITSSTAGIAPAPASVTTTTTETETKQGEASNV